MNMKTAVEAIIHLNREEQSMTKNQINYLLILLTIFVAWFYFNTFYTDARMQKRMTQLSARPASGPMMNSSAYPAFFPNMGGQAAPQSNLRQQLPPEAQKMMEQWRAARRAGKLPSNTPGVKPATTPAVTQEKK